MLLGFPPSFLRTKLSHTSGATRFPRSRQPPSVQAWLRPSSGRSTVSLNVFACTAPTIQLNPGYQALPTTASTCLQQSCSTCCPQHSHRICAGPCVLWIIDRVLYNRYIVDIHTIRYQRILLTRRSCYVPVQHTFISVPIRLILYPIGPSGTSFCTGYNPPSSFISRGVSLASASKDICNIAISRPSPPPPPLPTQHPRFCLPFYMIIIPSKSGHYDEMQWKPSEPLSITLTVE